MKPYKVTLTLSLFKEGTEYELPSATVEAMHLHTLDSKVQLALQSLQDQVILQDMIEKRA